MQVGFKMSSNRFWYFTPFDLEVNSYFRNFFVFVDFGPTIIS